MPVGNIFLIEHKVLQCLCGHFLHHRGRRLHDERLPRVEKAHDGKLLSHRCFQQGQLDTLLASLNWLLGLVWTDGKAGSLAPMQLDTSAHVEGLFGLTYDRLS